MLWNNIMQTSRELFVNPLLWTSHHMNLVGCQFVENAINPSTESIPDQEKIKIQGHQRSINTPTDAELLAIKPLATVKHRCLVDILVGQGRPFARYGKGPEFFFAGIPVHQPCYTVFHRHAQPQLHENVSSAPSLIGYIHYGHVKGDRSRIFEARPDPRGRGNRIGAEIGKNRLARVTPKQWTEDPYFICSRLLVTNMTDHECIYLYETEITAEFLRALDEPKAATDDIEWSVVRWRRLSFKPYDTFADRLAAELMAPNTGSSCCENKRLSIMIGRRELDDSVGQEE
ncbi:hypothetical protein P170DRAFT_443279 [Aspergillus steynii IBT 23096]|uniref:Uncharacterized protein n=1 Tax=Aspergillus steynii IBT 23096 TaxID=1392250 RepID=A0A2I2GRJ2_9EURO|nr:uncharacterized protein P170DRAFT_443279 [Aspergillus steynii IBT 23096]PLB55497.1 hypothetical protein P170DRAFT_443279 [Aspergillus steynii IBT 23096]